MKNRNRICAVLGCLMLFLAIAPLSVNAAPAATFTGPGTVRAGDTITVTFAVDGSNIKLLQIAV